MRMRHRGAAMATAAIVATVLFAATPANASEAPNPAPSTPVSQGMAAPDGQIQPMDATGCTAAPGGFGNTVCITVINPTPAGGAMLDYSALELYSPSSNVCNLDAQWLYLPRFATGWQTLTMYSTGCHYGYWGLRWDPSPNIELQNSQEICGRVRDQNATGGIWTAWVCETIWA